MDDNDLINQCWEFYSHDSFTCESDCLAKGRAQGTILSIDVGGKFYGSDIEQFWDESNLEMGDNNNFPGKDDFESFKVPTFMLAGVVVLTVLFCIAQRVKKYRGFRGVHQQNAADDMNWDLELSTYQPGLT
eukprot:scaffold17607_cov77-Cylindrotheca_fusiformis.AAC.2